MRFGIKIYVNDILHVYIIIQSSLYLQNNWSTHGFGSFKWVKLTDNYIFIFIHVSLLVVLNKCIIIIITI